MLVQAHPLSVHTATLVKSNSSPSMSSRSSLESSPSSAERSPLVELESSLPLDDDPSPLDDPCPSDEADLLILSDASANSMKYRIKERRGVYMTVGRAMNYTQPARTHEQARDDISPSSPLPSSRRFAKSRSNVDCRCSTVVRAISHSNGISVSFSQ